MADYFYFDENGSKQGPVTGGQLKGLAKAGHITPETIVESETGKSAPARKVQGLTFLASVPHDLPPKPHSVPVPEVDQGPTRKSRSIPKPALIAGIVAITVFVPLCIALPFLVWGTNNDNKVRQEAAFAAARAKAELETTFDVQSKLEMQEALNRANPQGRNDPEAQFLLGTYYAAGQGGAPQNAEEAAVWFRYAADGGHSDAQYRLGDCYYTGTGVSEDIEEAKKWFLRSKSPRAKTLLEEIEKREAAALAAALAVAEAERLAEAARREQERKDREPAEAAERRAAIDREVSALLHEAEQGDAGAQNRLASRYAEGNGVTKNLAEAAKWFDKAAEQGDANAKIEHALRYIEGEVVPKSPAEAAKWFDKAAEQGDTNLKIQIALRYSGGNGIPQSVEKAVEWLNKAAERGNADAQFRIAKRYFDGDGIPKNAGEAIKWFTKAGGQGHIESQLQLGEYYLEFSTLNPGESRKWLRMAAEQGSTRAATLLYHPSLKEN